MTMDDRYLDWRPDPRQPHGGTRRAVIAAAAGFLLAAGLGVGSSIEDAMAAKGGRGRRRGRNRTSNKSSEKSTSKPGKPGKPGEDGEP